MNTETRYKLMVDVQKRYLEYRKQHPDLPITFVVVAVADEFGISETTLYRYLKKRL